MGLIGHIAKAFGRISGEASAGFGAGKALSSDLQAWKRGQDLDDNNHGAQMISPYQQSAWVYTAISAMADNLAQIPFRISRVGSDKVRKIRALRGSADPRHRELCQRTLGENIVESGDVVDLFDRPHPTMPRTLFWEQIVSWDALRGEFFLVPLDEADGIVDLSERSPRVRRMLTLDPSMFWHMVSGFELVGWRYTGSPLMSPLPSVMLAPSEVIHARAVNPYLYWRGLSPLTVALLPASADYAASMFMKGLLMNNADTGVIATTEQNLTLEQREQFTAALRERKRKAGTPDRPLFLSSGVKIEKPTISNVDMQFLETRKLLRQEIGAIYKVPESVMGFSESKSSSLSGGGTALNEEKLTFIQQNLSSKCHRYESAVDPIIKAFGDNLVGWFDLDSLPIMQDARRSRVDSASKVFAMGVPLNDVNRVYDLGFPEYKWGKVGMLPFNLQSAQSVVDGLDTPGADQATPGNSDQSPVNSDQTEETPLAAGFRFLKQVQSPTSKVQSPGQLKADAHALWKRRMRARTGIIRAYQSKASKVLNDFRVIALQRLEQHGAEPAKPKAQGSETKSLIDFIFSPVEFSKQLILVLNPVAQMAIETATEQTLSEIGRADDPWRMPPPGVKGLIMQRKDALEKVGVTVRDQLNTQLAEGYQNGESTEELMDRIRGKFNELSKSEAKRIAVTETNVVYGQAAHETAVHAGIGGHRWVAEEGARPDHEEAGIEYGEKAIPIDEPFNVGGEMLMHPGDPSGSAGNIINCRCLEFFDALLEGDTDSTD